jgi:hypothetical protein
MQDDFDRSGGESELTLADAINLVSRRMATAVVIAGAAIGLGIWARPSPPEYQAFATPNGIVRVNQSSGTVILCQPGRKCGIVLSKGQSLEDHKSFSFEISDKAPAIAPPSTPTATAPQPAPAPAPQPVVPARQ